MLVPFLFVCLKLLLWCQAQLFPIFHQQARHIYICDHHKDVIQSLRSKRKRKDSEDDSGETDSEHPEVDLYQLQVNTLRRYKKHYKVHVRQGLNKAQLADVSIWVCYEKGCVIIFFSMAGNSKCATLFLNDKDIHVDIDFFFQCMTRHFKTIPVQEKDDLTYFIYMVKTNKNKLDREHRADGMERE